MPNAVSAVGPARGQTYLDPTAPGYAPQGGIQPGQDANGHFMGPNYIPQSAINASIAATPANQLLARQQAGPGYGLVSSRPVTPFEGGHSTDANGDFNVTYGAGGYSGRTVPGSITVPGRVSGPAPTGENTGIVSNGVEMVRDPQGNFVPAERGKGMGPGDLQLAARNLPQSSSPLLANAVTPPVNADSGQVAPAASGAYNPDYQPETLNPGAGVAARPAGVRAAVADGSVNEVAGLAAPGGVSRVADLAPRPFNAPSVPVTFGRPTGFEGGPLAGQPATTAQRLGLGASDFASTGVTPGSIPTPPAPRTAAEQFDDKVRASGAVPLPRPAYASPTNAAPGTLAPAVLPPPAVAEETPEQKRQREEQERLASSSN